jgi:hypothetical protein
MGPRSSRGSRGRLLGASLQDFLGVAEALLDPLDGRELEHLRPAAAEPFELLPQRLDPPLGLDEGLGQCLASTPLADEVQEVRETPFLGSELGLLHANVLGEMLSELADLRRDLLKDVPHLSRA